MSDNLPAPPTRVLLGLLLVSLALTGCSEDEAVADWPDPEVQVVLMPGNLPRPGVRVVVLDPATNTVVAGPVVSSVNGTCLFPDLERGGYALLAFGGAETHVVWQPRRWDYPHGGAWKKSAWPLDPARSAPVPGPVQILVEEFLPPAGLPRISGQIVDAGSGEPLDRAFISASPFLTGYLGQTTYRDDVTGSDGRFTVSEIPFAQDPQSGNLIQVLPLFITREGYRPLSWTHSLAHGDDNLDITGVTIPLQPRTGQDTGGLSGRLLLDGQPAAGVLVGLGGAADPNDPVKGAAGQPGFVAETGAGGVFTFTGLPAGVYHVHPGFLPDDGFTFLDQEGNVGRQVLPDQVTPAGDLWMVHEIFLHWPSNGMSVNPENLGPLQWAPVTGAANYDVFLDRGYLGNTEETTMPLPADWFPAAGLHYWRVVAYDTEDHIVGALDRPGVFYWPETTP
jgi:hypothetical protein